VECAGLMREAKDVKAEPHDHPHRDGARDGDDDEGAGWVGWEDEDNSWGAVAQALAQLLEGFKHALSELRRGGPGAGGKDAALGQLAERAAAELGKELKTDRRLGRAQTCETVRERFVGRVRDGFKALGGATPASMELLNRVVRAAVEQAQLAQTGGATAAGGDGHGEEEEDGEEEEEYEEDDGDYDGGGGESREGTRDGDSGAYSLPQADGADSDLPACRPARLGPAARRAACLPQLDGVVRPTRGPPPLASARVRARLRLCCR
jgi:hypothetical protein